jgi:hypothetical protein
VLLQSTVTHSSDRFWAWVTWALEGSSKGISPVLRRQSLENSQAQIGPGPVLLPNLRTEEHRLRQAKALLLMRRTCNL